MPLHPENEAELGQMNEAEGPALTEMNPSEGREMYRAMQPEAPDLEVGKVEDLRIPGPGGDIPIRIYTPQRVGPFPITLIHKPYPLLWLQIYVRQASLNLDQEYHLSP